MSTDEKQVAFRVKKQKRVAERMTRAALETYRDASHKHLTEGKLDIPDVVCQLLTSICVELEYLNDYLDRR